jgi:site-specific recombinase XerD
MKETLVRSYAVANRELANAFERYLIAKGLSACTIRAYNDAVTRLLDSVGSASVADVERSTIRQFLYELDSKGITSNSIRLHTCALRSFFKFLRLAEVSRHDPMLLIAHRKIPQRLPVVLSLEEVGRLIAAAKDPFERAVPEVLYATGVRVAEFVKLRLKDILWGVDRSDPSSIRVRNGKGGKDRVVLFGGKAAEAIREYQKWRPSEHGFLFESPARTGHVQRKNKAWYGHFYADGTQHEIAIGKISDIPTREEAKQVFELLASKIPGYHATPAGPYTPQAIREVLHRLALRAKLGRVHPHALRRAMASHLLQDGAQIGAVQELLGHERLNTTMLYTHLTAEHLKKVHEKCHPHEQQKGDAHGEEE